MLELDPSAPQTLLLEAELDLAGLLAVRHRLAPGADLPGEQQSARWVPDEHPSPVNPEVLRTALEAAPSLAALERETYCILGCLLSDCALLPVAGRYLLDEILRAVK